VHDEAWFDVLYREHHTAVLSYARRRGAEPDDLVAEVFATAWRHRDRVPDPALPWLLRTARNFLLHEARGRARRARLAGRARGRVGIEGDHADGVAERRDAEITIRSALAKLSATDQELLRLAAWEQLDTPALAYVLECSEVAARVRLHRATRRLRQMLTIAARQGPAPDDPTAPDHIAATRATCIPDVRISGTSRG
jgi:RNA polymerase sigma-70 factor (ECF subfamily)